MLSRCNDGSRVIATRVPLLLWTFLSLAAWDGGNQVGAQSVGLPAPHLLTLMPMGGKTGSEFELAVTGNLLEESSELVFSNTGITAVPKTKKEGGIVPGRFIVSVSKDCPVGVYEVRMMTRHGISSSRIFSVGELEEIVQAKPSLTLKSAIPLSLNTLCNAVMPKRAINHYRFTATQGQRFVVDCGAKGVDSKSLPVLIIADSQGQDLVVERRGDRLDFTAPLDGEYVIKVHELTFQGGPHYFYRLALREVIDEELPVPFPVTRHVDRCSWPPQGLSPTAEAKEQEPNDGSDGVHPSSPESITLPCDLAGSFFPAADVDTFDFSAKKGEVWWVEVASQRQGLPTNPTVLIQQVEGKGEDEKLVDVVELIDIQSPVKVSTNRYAYDGPPYNAGSSDVLGMFEVPQDGRYRLQVSDLFGGTRTDARNIYRLIVRKAKPGFSVVAWPLHMLLRNGDRSALSKPIALRPGSTMAMEVVVIRRDGFDDPIEISMEDLPQGVTAQGLAIAKGKTRGILLLTAAPDAKPGWTRPKLLATAEIGGSTVTHPFHFASMIWPIKDGRAEIPRSRLLEDVVVSVRESEPAPLSIMPAEEKIWEVIAGGKLTIPLLHEQRCDFSGSSISMKTLGAGFEQNKPFDIPLNEESSTVNLDLAVLKTPPGDYQIAFYGSGVAKYVASASTQSPKKSAAASKPVDTAEMIVSAPIRIRVQPAEKK